MKGALKYLILFFIACILSIIIYYIAWKNYWNSIVF